MTSRFVAVAVAMLIWAAPALAQGQATPPAWPQRSVKFIVPLGPGSGVDVTARIVANQLSARWGKPVVVENRPGGDAFVAVAAFTGARDDHTFLFAPTSSFTAHPYLHEKLPYDPADLVPVARVTATLAGVGATASLNVNNLQELVALARREPGKLNWAGITGALDFAFAGFLKDANLNINKIPYRDGVQAVNDLAEGRIQVYLTAVAIIRPHIQSGKVKLIAMANQERAPSMPDVQTAIEAGYPKLTFDGLVGLFGLRGVTDDLHAKVSADIQAVMADPAIVKQLEANNQLVRYGNPREFSAAIDVQRAQIATAAESLGIKAGR